MPSYLAQRNRTSMDQYKKFSSISKKTNTAYASKNIPTLRNIKRK